MVYQLSKNTYLLTTLKTDIHLSRRPLYTAFKLTQFGSVISSGMVTKHSVNRAEPCRTDLHWDLLTKPGQYGSVIR